MKAIKRIAIVPTAMALALIALIIRVIIGILVYIFISIPAVQEALNAAANLGVISNLGALSTGVKALTLIVLGPIVSFVVTFISVAVFALIYNWIARYYAVTLDI